MQFADPDHTQNVYFSAVATRETGASIPDIFCAHTASAMNRQVRLRQALSAPCAENPSQKYWKFKLQNSGRPPPNHNMVNAAHYVAQVPNSAPPSAAAS